MRYAEILRILGNYLGYFSLLLWFPLSIALYYEYVELPEFHPQPHSSFAFALSLLVCFSSGMLCRFLGRSAKGLLFRREGLLLVALIWIVSSVIAALPFYFSGTLKNPLDAYFESMSGLTTTGATLISAKNFDANGTEIPLQILSAQNSSYLYYGTIDPITSKEGALLTGLDAVSRAILVWRSFLQWLGGMGIVVLFLTILPALGVGGKTLYQTETTGPVKEGISPRLKETASLLWKLYISLSILELILLLVTNRSLPFLDAICITFSNLSTGGFSIHENSIAYYNNMYTEWIVILFMILGSINFALYFYVIRMQFYRIYRTDFFLFLTLILIGSLCTGFFLWGKASQEIAQNQGIYSLGSALRSGAFQWISAQSSTGYFTANYDLWPLSAQSLFLIAMFLGGMAGSTSGGMKTTRYYLLYKIACNRLEGLFRPETVRKIYFSKTEITPTVSIMILLFFCVGLFSSVVGASLYIMQGIDIDTSLGLISCFINNVGIAFREAGPLRSMTFLSPAAKLLSIFWMLVGRLEYFAIFVLLLPGFWKRK